jgi:hypothetical protein
MTFKCWFNHSDNTVLERDNSGALVLRCLDCEQTIPILQSEMVKDGPCHQPPVIAGQPQTRVISEVRG